MRKAIYKTDWMKRELNQEENESLIGYVPDCLLKSVKYFLAPKNPGRYLVIKKDGTIAEYMCTGTHCVDRLDEKSLFAIAAHMDNGFDEEVFIDDRQADDSDIMDIYRSPWSTWYTFNEWYDQYESCHTDLHIFTKESDDYPVYFLDMNLDDKIQMEENGEIHSDGDPVYFKLDDEYEFVAKET